MSETWDKDEIYLLYHVIPQYVNQIKRDKKNIHKSVSIMPKAIGTTWQASFPKKSALPLHSTDVRETAAQLKAVSQPHLHLGVAT